MAEFHKQMNDIYNSEYEWMWDTKTIEHIHIRVYLGEYMDWSASFPLPVGSGNIDFDNFL